MQSRAGCADAELAGQDTPTGAGQHAGQMHDRTGCAVALIVQDSMDRQHAGPKRSRAGGAGPDRAGQHAPTGAGKVENGAGSRAGLAGTELAGQSRVGAGQHANRGGPSAQTLR
jgi:hypothetical protein